MMHFTIHCKDAYGRPKINTIGIFNGLEKSLKLKNNMAIGLA